MIAWLLLACWAPTETGADGFVGRVLTAEGEPVVGLKVESLETGAVTDAEGKVAVEWKEPNEEVHFHMGRTYFQRRRQAGDLGELSLVLPELAPRGLECGPVDADVVLRWELGPGYFAQIAHRCAPGESVRFPTAPAGDPVVRRRDVGEAEPEALVLRGDTLVLLGPKRRVSVTVKSDARPPEACAVRVGEAAVAAVADGWEALLAGPAVVQAVCEGRPARPVLLAGDAASVSLPWSDVGPELDAGPAAPWAQAMLLVLDGEQGWSLKLQGVSGLFALPPLEAGVYRVSLAEAEAGLMPPLIAEAGALGSTLALSGAEGGPWAGAFRLDAPLDEGRVRVVQAAAP